jgi:hypothetical protein
MAAKNFAQWLADRFGITLKKLYDDIVEAAGGGLGATVAEDEITLSDNATNNSSTSKHGFLKKLSNVASEFLNGQGNFAAVTKSDVGLSNVDNTADTGKPVSTATQTALNAKQDALGFTAENVANKDIDGTLAADSDTKYPSQKAVKTYVDGHAGGVTNSAGANVIAKSDGTNLVASQLNVPDANTVEQRNGANPQAFNLYDTYTSGSNYRRLHFSANLYGAGILGLVYNEAGASATSTLMAIGNDSAGGDLLIRAGATVWKFKSGGEFQPNADNDRDIGNASVRVRGVYVVRVYYSATVFDAAGTGTPEGAVTAGIGSTFRRTDGGAATSFYVKESGTGNTGWIAK